MKNKFSGAKTMIATAISCKTSITGIPATKYQCLVLCLNKYIPAMEPIEPPIIATKKSVASGILHFLLLALDLSTPIIISPKRLTAARYIKSMSHISSMVSPELFSNYFCSLA